MKPINLKEKHSLFTKQWHPHQIATVDNMQVILAKIQHCPSTKNGEEVHLLLFEKQDTAHTGAVSHEMTQTNYPKI